MNLTAGLVAVTQACRKDTEEQHPEDSGFFPGSGFQTPGDGSTGAIRGRLEFGNRVGNLRFVARFMNGSDEYTKLKDQFSDQGVWRSSSRASETPK
jgi:hypothetical protein